MCWQIRDPEQVGLLTMLQNGIVRITIENPQMEMFCRQAEAENAQYGLDLTGEEVGEDVDGALRPLLPGHEDEAEDDSPIGEEVTAEELEDGINN
ncbi:MAG TPA: hypothetical protein PLX49_02155 [Prolixibacteraceae bacterium]|nr:hypothetical protein [Prolixibacteraceae bacterium]